MKRLLVFIIFTVLVLPVFASADMARYALVQKDKIVKMRQADTDDAVLIPKLLAHGYLIVEETLPPMIDPITETLSFEYTIKDGKVVKSYTVTPRSTQEIKNIKTDMAKQQAVDSFTELLSIDMVAVDIEPLLVKYKANMADVKGAEGL